MASMEHPIFSLATKPDTRVQRYEHKNVTVEIAPSVRGLAMIYDKDILIYCASQLMGKKNAGEPLGQTLHLNAHDRASRRVRIPTRLNSRSITLSGSCRRPP
jgi:hypothetical protein